MFKIDDNNNIHITRGDSAVIKLESEEDLFVAGDVLTLSVVKRGNYNDIEFQKIATIAEGASAKIANITLAAADTKGFCPLFKNGVKEYWYEIQLNQSGFVTTLVGYDTDGAKIFYIYPEAEDPEGSI